jgi:hypothetical protein
MMRLAWRVPIISIEQNMNNKHKRIPFGLEVIQVFTISIGIVSVTS